MKTVIIGGVAGGASAAARLRRLDEQAEIVLFERGEHISFANCGLPYYIGQVIKERENLLVVTPDVMTARFNISVRTMSEVIRINRDQKTVTVKDHRNNNAYDESYDKLVLSPGAAPLRPRIPGIQSSRIFTLRNIPDTDAITQLLDNESPRRAVIVGGGFIGLEMAENLHLRGLQVTLVEMASQVMAPLDFEMSAIIHQHLQMKQIEFYLNDGVAAFQDKADTVETELSSGKRIVAELVILAIGVQPEKQLAEEAGLTVNRGIVVNSHMATSDPDIFAVGDAVEIKDYVSGTPTLVPLAWPANKQGRIAADNIAGNDKARYNGTQGTSIAKLFDLTIAATGLNERQLSQFNIPCEKSYTHSAQHAGYYPGAVPMSIKLLFAPDNGRILGAQIVGVEGVDKRIDVMATALRAGMSVRDLEDLELAYAPPFSSAKDPSIMAGFVATNILDKKVRVFHWTEVENHIRDKDFLLDVRTPEEFDLGAIPSAINIPVDDLRDRIGELPRHTPIYVYCQIGLRGYIAARILTQCGLDARNLSGGYKTWYFTTLKQSNEDIYDNDKITLSDHIVAVGGDTTHVCADHTVDACGLQCPGPIMQLYAQTKSMRDKEIVEVRATDPGFWNDIESWCQRTGNRLLDRHTDNGIVTAMIRKESAPTDTQQTSLGDGKTVVLFSGDFDKAMAAMIIANTAASMGKRVSIFFTFWGLNLLRRSAPPKVNKNIVEKMFGAMMPRGPEQFTLSKMHMMGMGTSMMKGIMKKKQVATLNSLMQSALDNNVRFIACQMTMELMGLKQEELIEGIEFGGAATYISNTDTAGTNLFI